MTSAIFLRIRHVTAGYVRGRPVLRDVDLTATAGKVVAVVGPNGGGKSTLLRVASGRLGPWAGTVELFGRPSGGQDRRRLARQLALLPQSPTCVPDATVGDVLAGGRAPHWGAFGSESPADVDAVEAVAVRLGIADWLRRRVDDLSGGQRQRVLLARCLVQIEGAASAVLLLDEPDTFLDLRYKVELADTLRATAEAGPAVVTTSHDLHFASRVADEVTVVAGGSVGPCGPPRAVLDAGRLSAAYGVPLRRVESEAGVVIVPA